MAVRFFNAVGWVGFVFALAVLMLAYAGFPDEVLVQTAASGEPLTYLSKNMVFYGALIFLALANLALLALWQLRPGGEVLAFSHSLLHLIRFFFNLFFATAIYFINILNSREDFAYNHFGYLIYVTGTLLALVVLLYPLVRYGWKK